MNSQQGPARPIAGTVEKGGGGSACEDPGPRSGPPGRDGSAVSTAAMAPLITSGNSRKRPDHISFIAQAKAGRGRSAPNLPKPWQKNAGLLFLSRGVHRQQPFRLARQMYLSWLTHHQAISQEQLEQRAIFDGVWAVYKAFKQGKRFRGEFFQGHLTGVAESGGAGQAELR